MEAHLPSIVSLYVLVSEASDPDIVKDEAKQEGSSGRRLSWSEGNDRSGRQGMMDTTIDFKLR